MFPALHSPLNCILYCLLILPLPLCLCFSFPPSQGFSPLELQQLKNTTRDLVYHGLDAYITHGFPYDEVGPLSCTPRVPNSDIFDVGHNDALGEFMLTAVDSIDTLAVMGDRETFAKTVKLVESFFKSDSDRIVQVFETTIRVIGGLLSAHFYASEPRLGVSIPDYDGFLLDRAVEIADRLLVAFETSSGIPEPRVNLRHPYDRRLRSSKLTGETCTAGAGSLILEFTLLSKLTGNSVYEQRATAAFHALWARRSEIDAVPMDVDPHSGEWISTMTGIGASIDSFYEYALKHGILFNNDTSIDVFQKAYRAVRVHGLDDWIYRNFDFQDGSPFPIKWIDSLAAFFPTLQVLNGDIDDAVKLHMVYFKIWNTYSAIPERWGFLPRSGNSAKDDVDRSVSLPWYPLRPEFIESNYYLYRATRDPFYLQVARAVLEDLANLRTRKCGFASVKNVVTGILEDKMDSFVLSETLKYLYLTFDEGNLLNHEMSNFVFSTEGHPFWYNPERDALKRRKTPAITTAETAEAEKSEKLADLSDVTSDSVHISTRASDASRDAEPELSTVDTDSDYPLLQQAKQRLLQSSLGSVLVGFGDFYHVAYDTLLEAFEGKKVGYMRSRFWRDLNIHPLLRLRGSERRSVMSPRENRTEVEAPLLPVTIWHKVSKTYNSICPLRLLVDDEGGSFPVSANFPNSTCAFRPRGSLYQFSGRRSYDLTARSLFSQVSSWSDFYFLDWRYQYKQPLYLRQYVRDLRSKSVDYIPIELDPRFHSVFTDPNSQCRAYSDRNPDSLFYEIIAGDLGKIKEKEMFYSVQSNMSQVGSDHDGLSLKLALGELSGVRLHIVELNANEKVLLDDTVVVPQTVVNRAISVNGVELDENDVVYFEPFAAPEESVLRMCWFGGKKILCMLNVPVVNMIAMKNSDPRLEQLNIE